jgi:ribosomal protein S18 acetylase RimI-like enzyme
MIETGIRMEVRELTICDFEQVVSLWQGCEGVCLHSDVDSRYAVGLYLARNPGLSFVAVDDGSIIGAVLCGHDGRRGYLHHIAVSQGHRRSGIGTALVDKAIDALRHKGICGCNGLVLSENSAALEFWRSIGWVQRDDLKVVSKSVTL